MTLLKNFLLTLAGAVLLTACDNNAFQADPGQQEGLPSVAANNAPPEEGAKAPADAVAMDVYKSESCGCCGVWIDYMEERGFALDAHHPADLNAKKQELGVAPRYQSCHTAVTEQGYVFEGHIPARYIEQFLASPPQDAVGLAVPGMPLGSPGMEVDDRFTPYQVLLLKKDGSAEVFASVNSPADQ